MFNLPESTLINRLRKTQRCLSQLEPLIEEVGDFTSEEAEPFAWRLLEAYDFSALDRWLNICALKKIKVGLRLLIETTELREFVSDYVANLACHDETSYALALELVRNRRYITLERLAMLRLAAELAVTHGLDREPVRTELRKLRVASKFTHDYPFFLIGNLLEKDDPDAELIIPEKMDLREILPMNPPPKNVGRGTSWRRDEDKVGRNDPCPCGGGKKYKKCCMQKKAEELVEIEHPATMDLFDENGFYKDVQALGICVLRRLDIEKIRDDQLFRAFRMISIPGSFDKAFELLLKIKSNEKKTFNDDHFVELLSNCIKSEERTVARKILDYIDTHDIEYDEYFASGISIFKHPEAYEYLEQQCVATLNYAEHPESKDNPMISGQSFLELAYDFNPGYPGLSTAFARAAIVGNKDSDDNYMLLEIIEENRVNLGYASWGDPAADLCDDDDMEETLTDALEQQATINQLRETSETTQQKLKEKNRALREMGAQLNRQQKHQRMLEEEKQATTSKPDHQSQENAKEMERLRRKLNNLKIEITGQHKQRETLQQELRKNERKVARQNKAVEKRASEASSPEQEQDMGDIPTVSHIDFPAYADSFRNDCKSLPVSLQIKAMKAFHAFSLHDQNIYHHTRKLEQLSHHYRIRIGIHYRLILQWIPGESLIARALITREGFDRWIRQHQG